MGFDAEIIAQIANTLSSIPLQIEDDIVGVLNAQVPVRHEAALRLLGREEAEAAPQEVHEERRLSSAGVAGEQNVWHRLVRLG